MKPILESGLKTFQIIILLAMLSGVLLADVTYDEIIDLNATCPGSDSCNQPMTPDTLEHCSCSSFCSLLGTCCVDSKYRNRYPKPLKNIECEYIPGREVHRFVPMIKTCDRDLEYDKTTEKLCNGNGEALNDPFLKIPVTDPITGISYKNYYCFACNKHFGAKEPILWNPEIKIKANNSLSQMHRFNADGKTQKKKNNVLRNMNSSSGPNLHYDSSRRTWVMDHNQKNATDVEFYASLPTELKNVTPVCYDLVFEMVSECAADWMDENIAKKCLSYMAVISAKSSGQFLGKYYRNPHCAICNYQSVDHMDCYVEENSYGYNIFVSPEDIFIKLFYIKDETKNCIDNMVFDQFSKKCRRVYGAKRRKETGNFAKPTLLPQMISTSANPGYLSWVHYILKN